MKRIKIAAMLAACGATAAVANAQDSGVSSPYLINISGATLFEAFFTANASTNDAIDVDGDGCSRFSGDPCNQQLAPFGLSDPYPANQWWQLQYRATGSGNGLAELVAVGTIFATGMDGVEIDSANSENAYNNRVKYIDEDLGLLANANTMNPGAAPVRTMMDGSYLITPYVEPGIPSAGGLQIDLGVTDVPFRWFVTQDGSNDFDANPGDAGYGNNDRTSVTQGGQTEGDEAGQGNKLKDLGALVLFDPKNPPAPDADNVVFDTQIAFVPIAVITNLGTGLETITYTEQRHMLATGRMPSGENLVQVTRDSGSGTRNGHNNSFCMDPSWAVGENVGRKDTAPEKDQLGPSYIPSNKGGSGSMEGATRNHRLAIGYTGAERGESRGWLTGGQMEVLAVQNDLAGGEDFVRPTANAVLDNDLLTGYNIGGPETIASIGDPRSAPEAKGGDAGNMMPDMRNVEAAAYVNNITRSVAGFVDGEVKEEDLFTPGEFLVTQFILLEARDFSQNLVDPCILDDIEENASLQLFSRQNSVLRLAPYQSFGTVTTAGIAPTRESGPTYSDGVEGGVNYVTLDGQVIGYASDLDAFPRNALAGDMNNDGARNCDDAGELVEAWIGYYGCTADWDGNGVVNAADVGAYISQYFTEVGGMGDADFDGNGVVNAADVGAYLSAYFNQLGACATWDGGGDLTACPEILADFNGDGNFDTEDVRYFADGLALDENGVLDRAAGFTKVDEAFGGNFFRTRLATGKAYQNGDSRGDVTNSDGNNARGWTILADGVVDSHDIDFVYAQFQNANINGGEVDWSDLNEAVFADLSADVNGDLLINQADVCDLVLNVLGTTFGDVDLDGDADADDRMIIMTNLGGEMSGWRNGDLNGDGVIDQTDLDIQDGTINLCK